MINTVLGFAGDLLILLGEGLRSGEIRWPSRGDDD